MLSGFCAGSAVSAVCMAAFGIVQYLAGNGKFFWFYSHPFTATFGGAKGSFTNKNHFAYFLALGVGPLIWWLLNVSRRMRPGIHGSNIDNSFCRNRREELKTYLIGLALAVVLFAGLMSLSRGGMAALLLAALVSAAICYWAAAGGGRFLGILLAACVLIGAALSIFGLDHVGSRLETLTSADRAERWSAEAGWPSGPTPPRQFPTTYGSERAWAVSAKSTLLRRQRIERV